MVSILTWYLAISALGIAAWPLAFRLLPGLPDRGYTISRALGLMLAGYVFWLLGSLGFLGNTVGGILFSMLIVGGLALWAYMTRPDQTSTLLGWVIAHPKTVIAAELLFAIAFAGWAIFRGFNPDIQNTEKPMELMFLNGVRMSSHFPPLDAWLSGYAISYYYFGYVLVGLLADLTGTASGVAFNLAIALLFALTLLGSYGIVYNLTAARFEAQPEMHSRLALSALLGPLFVGLMGNLGGLAELLRSLALPLLPASFWAWLDIEDMGALPSRVWPPDTWRYWWWFRASRVIRDRDIAGNAIGLQPIDEFPIFSFLLGDMHPHVLAIPFVLVALALAFNMLRQRGQLNRAQFALYAVSFGALAFLNTWDLPIYLFILVMAMAVRSIFQVGRFEARSMIQPILTGLGILAVGILAYLPWYISFSSQAGGILPNALFPTRFHQFFVMFGPFLIFVVWLLVDRGVRNARRMDWVSGAVLAAAVLVLLFAAAMGLGFVALQVDPGVRAFVVQSVSPALEGASNAMIEQQLPSILQQVILHRLRHPLTALVLTAIIGLSLSLILPKPPSESQEDSQPLAPYLSLPTAFALMLILTGALLTLGPEFLYLRDVFGQRLNTVFKFYYAAWILFGIAAAYGAYLLMMRSGAVTRIAASAVLALIIVAGLVYPVLAIPARIGEMDCRDPEVAFTLDGIDYIRRCYPQDYLGIVWLQQNGRPGDVVLEAVGGPYSYFGRVSMATGIPTLLGWPGHEHQWRGELYGELAGSRETDIREIYNTHSMQRAEELIRQYGVKYIFVGSLETTPGFASPGGLEKFARFFPAVFQADGVTIYRADQPLIEEETQP